MTQLTTKQVYLPVQPPVQQVAQSINFVKPLSYEYPLVDNLNLRVNVLFQELVGHRRCREVQGLVNCS